MGGVRRARERVHHGQRGAGPRRHRSRGDVRARPPRPYRRPRNPPSRRSRGRAPHRGRRGARSRDDPPAARARRPRPPQPRLRADDDRSARHHDRAVHAGVRRGRRRGRAEPSVGPDRLERAARARGRRDPVDPRGGLHRGRALRRELRRARPRRGRVPARRRGAAPRSLRSRLPRGRERSAVLRRGDPARGGRRAGGRLARDPRFALATARVAHRGRGPDERDRFDARARRSAGRHRARARRALERGQRRDAADGHARSRRRRRRAHRASAARRAAAGRCDMIDFGLPIGIGAAALAVLLYMMASLRVVKEYERGVYFFLGRYQGIKGPGLRVVLVPFFRMVIIDLRTIVTDVPPQEVITRDNVSCKVNAVIYFRVIHPDQAVLQVENYLYATSQIAQTTLRSVVGANQLDDLLAERDRLNDTIQKIMDAETDPWGIKVSSVEIKHVEIPQEMRRAMARGAEAERERRAKVISAEGELQASSKYAEAARILSTQRGSLQLRYLETLVEIAAENNSTTVFPLPLELLEGFVTRREARGEPRGRDEGRGRPTIPSQA
ncbi:MAG: slipin family protein [Deltaproteobacteria bacterium]|nr:slipin family protein [Deltaproteobacteria bacterium]